MPINKNAIKLAQMLDLNVDKAQKLTDVMSLSDLASLTTAINSDDFLTVREIFNRYKHEIDGLPDAGEVKKYYDDQLMVNNDADEALAATADFYGIKGEDVEMLIGKVTEEKKDREEIFIPDVQVARAYKNVKEMLKGGKSDGSLMEVKRAWQRRMFYGLIDPVTAAVLQPLIDMTPMEVMQQYCKLNHYGEPAIKENTMSLDAMLEAIIEDKLHNIDKESDEEDHILVTMDMGTINPAEDGEIAETGPNTHSEDYKNWIVKTVVQAPKGKFKGVGTYQGKLKRSNIFADNKDSAEDVIKDLKDKIDQMSGEDDAEGISGKYVTIDFNKEFSDSYNNIRNLYIDIDEFSGEPILLVSEQPQTGFSKAAPRTGQAHNQEQPHALNISVARATKAGLKFARYALGKEIPNFAPGVDAWSLVMHSAVVQGTRRSMGEPGFTVARNAQESLIKSISDKKF